MATNQGNDASRGYQQHPDRHQPRDPPSTLELFSPQSSQSQSRTPTPLGSSLLTPLPSELFLLALQQLSFHDLLVARGVSKAWCTFVNGEGSLWPTRLRRLVLDQSTHLEFFHYRDWISRKSVNGKRSGQGIQQINVDWLDEFPIDVNWNPYSVIQRFVTFIDDLAFTCTPSHPPTNRLGSNPQYFAPRSTLLSASFSISPTSREAVEIFFMLVRLSSAPLFADLRSLRLCTLLPGMLIHPTFFSIWPDVESLIISGEVAHDPTSRLDWNHFSSPTDEQRRHRRVRACHRLGFLQISGASIGDLELPAFPCLTRIVLTNVFWKGRSLILLLRLARRTLRFLKLDSVELLENEDNEETDWERYVFTRDPDLIDDVVLQDEPDDHLDEPFEVPPPIIFPVLHTFVLQGDDTLPIFTSLDYCTPQEEDSFSSTPVFVMPSLRKADFNNLTAELDQDGEVEGPMAIFGRNAPNLLDLSLSSSIIGDMLFYSLAAMNGRLQILNLSTTAVTDKLIARLADVVPALRELDVTGCDDVSASGVARFVQIVRLGENQPWKLDRVYLDPPRWDADVPAWDWLDYINVLVRSEDDFEGLGPSRTERNGLLFRRWKKNGKVDAQKEERRFHHEQLLREQIKLAETQAILESRYGFLPGTQAGSASSAAGIQMNLGRLPALPSLPIPQPNNRDDVAYPSFDNTARFANAAPISIDNGEQEEDSESSDASSWDEEGGEEDAANQLDSDFEDGEDQLREDDADEDEDDVDDDDDDGEAGDDTEEDDDDATTSSAAVLPLIVEHDGGDEYDVIGTDEVRRMSSEGTVLVNLDGGHDFNGDDDGMHEEDTEK